jgi:glycosyltransferase involved in cell wall biosynthesis
MDETNLKMPPLPLVSVLTPVYNGENFLTECIESILAQSYDNWEYVIVDNCSTDGTLEIARRYENKDSRIKVVANSKFVSAIENHNIAFRRASVDSGYCKVVSADDWIYPECIEKLVTTAEETPDVGIVQAYAINAMGVRWPGLPIDKTVFAGREICRLYLFGKLFLAAPTSLLYRSSQVRSNDPFFPGAHPSADAAACLNCLQSCSFAVVHQILSFERIHKDSVTTMISELDSYLLDRLSLLRVYGPQYLTLEELEARWSCVLEEYYNVLAAAVVNRKGREFWRYHQRRFRAEYGQSLYRSKLGKALCLKIIDLLCNPQATFEKVIKRANSS